MKRGLLAGRTGLVAVATLGALTMAAVVALGGCGGHVSDSSGTGGAGTTNDAGAASATGTNGTAGATGGSGGASTTSGGGTTTTGPEAWFSCGSLMCLKATQVCVKVNPGPCCNPPMDKCEELPEACKMPGATCDCFEQDGGTGPCGAITSTCQGSYEEGMYVSCFFE